jgi:tetratricopeptide (TPR) repeat protein
MGNNRKELLARIEAARQADDTGNAEILAREMAASFPHDVRGHRLLGKLLLKQERAAEAREQIDGALQHFENDRMLLGMRVDAQKKLRDMPGAIATALVLHGLEANGASYARLISLHLADKRIDEAAAFAREGVERFPDDPAVMAAASRAAGDAGDHELALRRAVDARRLDEQASGGHLAEARALCDLGRFAEGLDVARAGLERFPTHVGLLQIAFRSAAGAQDDEQALSFAERRVALTPHVENAYVDLVRAAVRLDRLELARKHADRALERFPASRTLPSLRWVISESESDPGARTWADRPSRASLGQSVSYIFSIPFNINRFTLRVDLSDPLTGRLSRPWIAYRIRLFMNYTCKSLINQTNQNFHALLLCDGASLDIVRDEISKYYALPRNIEIIDGDAHEARLAELMDGSEFYCQTKLDSDNMYHKHYVDYLHHHVPEPETKFLAFTKGYTFDANGGAIALYRATREYFYARVGRVEDWADDSKVAQPLGQTERAATIPHELIHEPAMLMITCHDTNVSNRLTLVHPTRTIFRHRTLETIWKDFTGDPEIHTLQGQD